MKKRYKRNNFPQNQPGEKRKSKNGQSLIENITWKSDGRKEKMKFVVPRVSNSLKTNRFIRNIYQIFPDKDMLLLDSIVCSKRHWPRKIDPWLGFVLSLSG